MLLALDTATRQAGVALYDGDEVRGELLWQAGRHHTEMMAPAIQELLARVRCQVSDLSAVAVSLGPGSFTGLRIGLALAKGLAVANGLPLIGIPTLDATAYPHLNDSVPVCALLHMGRGRLAYAFYPPGQQRHGAIQLGRLEDLIPAVEVPTRLVGELLRMERQTLQARLGSLAILPAPAVSQRRPGYLAEIAWQRLLRGDVDNVHTLAPMYADGAGATKSGDV